MQSSLPRGGTAPSGQAGSLSYVGRASRLSGTVQRLSSARSLLQTGRVSANSGQAGSLSYLCLCLCLGAVAAKAAPLRAGLIGLDTSHVPAFAKLFNDSKATGELANIRIVAGYPGGTDLPASRDRVGKFTEQLREMGLEIVDSIPKLLEKVDVGLLESVDGRT